MIEIDDPEALGARLRAVREAAGLSLRQLAFLGCTAPYISAIEHGRRVPSLQILHALATRLGVRARYLATGSDSDYEAELAQAEVTLYLGDDDGLEATLVSLAADADDEGVRARATGNLGVLELRRGSLTEGIERLESARELGGPAFLGWATLVEALGRSYATAGALEAAAQLFGQARDAATGRGDAPGVVRFTVLLANTYIDAGDMAHAVETVAAALADSTKLGDPLLRARVLWTQARMHTVDGRHDLAAELADRALTILRNAEDVHAVALAQQVLAFIELARDNPRRALELLDEAAPVLRRASDPLERASFQLERARALVALGDLGEAEREAREVAPVLHDRAAGGNSGRYFQMLGDLYQELGRDDDALVMYDEAIAFGTARSGGMPYLSLAYQQKAGLLEKLGREGEALQLLKAALNPKGSKSVK